MSRGSAVQPLAPCRALRPDPLSAMMSDVARTAQRLQIRERVGPAVFNGEHMVNLERSCGPAPLASAAVAGEH